MRLITTKEVADFLKIENVPTLEPHIDQAQAELIGDIRAKSLDLRQNITITKPINEWTEIIVVRDGPLSRLNSFRIDGVEIDEDDLIVEPWSVQWPGHTGSSVSMNYDRGYTRETIPFDLKRALIAMAAKIFQQPNVDVVYKQERVGDYSLTEQHSGGVPGGSGNQQPFPPELTTILKRYRKPQIA